MGILGPLAEGWRRGRARGAVRAGLAIAALGWAAAALAQAEAPREVRLEILASAEWAQTGIAVEPGDTLTIDAEPANAAGVVVPPDGLPPRGDGEPLFEGLPAPRLPYAALIGQIGAGPAFLVGRHYTIKTTEAGPLLLRWNIAEAPRGGESVFFPAVVRHERAPPPPPPPPDPTENKSDAEEGNRVGDNVAVEVVTPDEPAPPRPTRPDDADSSRSSSGTVWLAGGLVLLLLAAAAGLAVRRSSRARTARRTKALLGLSPSLDLAEGACRGGSLPAEGPAASLRARLEPGAARMDEGGEHG